MINQAVVEGLILYRNIDFLPYSPNILPLDTKFFNLFLGFKAKPTTEINPAIIDPILWHAKNIISGCGKNILIDFIGKKVLGSELFYATSDLGKILGRFNSCIQARKLIVMNETGMTSGDWHKYNDHLKSLITEDYLTVERKGIEPKVIKDYAGFMVLSNHDAPLRVGMGDRCIVCFDVSSRCKGNTAYFKSLAKVLEHPDAPSVVMAYLLSLDLSDWNPQDIPTSRMKTEILRDQLPNSIRFIINYISLWNEERRFLILCPLELVG